MGCIAIVCVLLFWFCYFGILAKLVVPVFYGFWVSAQPGQLFRPPPFGPAILPPSQTLSEAFPETLALFGAHPPDLKGFPPGTVRAMVSADCTRCQLPMGGRRSVQSASTIHADTEFR
jgi:hypothetical protein